MWLEEAGLYHFKARAYHPALGRFMQADPIGYGDGMNMYAYAGNDPVNARDPSGMTANKGPMDEIVVSGSLQRIDYGPSTPGHVWPEYSCGATCWGYNRPPGVSFADYGWVQGGGARGPASLGGEVSGGGGRASPGARPGRSVASGSAQGQNGRGSRIARTDQSITPECASAALLGFAGSVAGGVMIRTALSGSAVPGAGTAISGIAGVALVGGSVLAVINTCTDWLK